MKKKLSQENLSPDQILLNMIFQLEKEEKFLETLQTIVLIGISILCLGGLLSYAYLILVGM